MKGLMMHCGGEVVTLDDVANVPVPPATDTYVPIPHGNYVTELRHYADDIFKTKGLTFRKEQFGLARDGQRFFGVLQYVNGGMEGIGLSIGFRNSYDRSMAIGFAIGGSVFVCDNLALSGDIVTMRKHTGNVVEDLKSMIVMNLYKGIEQYKQIIQDIVFMREIKVDRLVGYEILGLMLGQKILTISQASVAYEEWRNPSFDDFKENTVWSLYNATTFALKSSPPNTILERHGAAHSLFMERFKGQGVKNHELEVVGAGVIEED